MLNRALLVVAVAFVVVPAYGDDDRILFNRDIRPILSDNCYHCHGNDKNHIKGKLLLNDRDAAIKRGAIVPGKPDESEAMVRILSDDPDDIMPPPDAHKKLTRKQKDLLRRWIAEGAEYQPHWAYVDPIRWDAPAVKDAKWVRNPIDAFVLARLEARRLSPSAEADKRTLLRRLSLDLIGLPPTPAEIDAFLADERPDAYERQVERLLASPHFGERMAVPWLDAVRYADTVGFHGDQNANVFPFRDYVINAFNSNKPFDQFTREQIAGDLLPNPTTEQLIASGFNRLNMMTREGGAQPKEYIARYQADRVRTVGLAWLGSTFGCAECHDHKFDPISIKDFYAMSAFFADIRQWGVYNDYRYTPNPDLRGWSNDHPFPPEILVDSPYLAARKQRLESALRDELFAGLRDAGGAASSQAEWRAGLEAFIRRYPGGWEPLSALSATVPAARTSSKAATRPAVTPPPALPGGFVAIKAVTGGQANELSFKPSSGWIAAIRLEAGGDVPGAASPTAQRTGLRLTASVKPDTGAARSAGVYHAEADAYEPRYSSTAEVIGVKDGWKLSTAHLSRTQSSVWLLDPPLKVADGESLVVSITGDVPLPVRVSVSPLAWWDALKVADPAVIASVRNDDKTAGVAWLISTAANADLFARYKSLQREILECRNGKSWMQVTVAHDPVITRVLPRGNWQDESGEVVNPATPHFLPSLEGVDGRRQNRLDLANWIVSDRNPLTSRTVVNRFWKIFFGSGLCASIEDLGLQGEWPSHPELLDWLSVEFRSPRIGNARPWDVKHVVRLIVTSNTYRQKSELQPKLRDVDPANRLLSAQSPVRLEAEFVRDNALFASGLLNLTDIGGPSVKPYQPEGYYAAIQFPNRVYVANADDRQYRRGVYMHWQRTFLHPMLANFDAPSREDSICTRVVSNTPQQGLTLLNDPQFVEASRGMAQSLIAAGGTDGDKIDRLYQRALARLPKDKEKASLLKLLDAQREIYKASAEEAANLLKVGNTPATGDPVELAAWTNTCRVVLNLHETITRY